MGRHHRRFLPGEVYHLVNRGNDKRVIFASDADYEHFLSLLTEGRTRAPVEIVGYSLMTTHFHLLVRPTDCAAIPIFMHFVEGQYALHWRTHTGTLGQGHVFKSRYFAKAAEDNLGRLTVLGYVEMNALTAGVVQRSEEWRWCSLFERQCSRDGLLTHGALELPSNWIEIVNLPWEEFQRAIAQHDFMRRCRFPWK